MKSQIGFAPIQLSDEERELVTTVRQFARRNGFVPSGDSPTRGGFDREFSVKLADRGWVGMTIPVEYGGTDRSGVERCLVISELLAAGAPLGAHWTADRQTAPSLLLNGPESLRQALLPEIAAGRCLMAGGFSEPDAGSDLASVRTRARKVDGGWRINGRKIWTTDAHRADYIEVLCRTSDSPKKHEGLSLLVVPMDAEGLDVRPIEGMDGEKHFNEVFLDDVFAHDDWLIGEEGSGWKQLTAELALERSGPERYLTTFPLFEAFVESRTLAGDSNTAHELIGRIIAQQMGLREMSLSIARQVELGGSPVAEAAMAKDLGTELEQLLVDELWAFRDEELSPGPAAERLHTFLDINRLRSAVFTTAGGTNEVLRLLVGRQLDKWAKTRRDWVLRSPLAETVYGLAKGIFDDDPEARSAPRGAQDPGSARLLGILREGEFLGVSVPEELGGGGGSYQDALDVIASAAYAGVSTPVIEGPVLAGFLLTHVARPFPWDSDLAVHASGDLVAEIRDGQTLLSGRLDSLRWAEYATSIVVTVESAGRSYIATVDVADLDIENSGVDIAGEPASTARLSDVVARTFDDSGLSHAELTGELGKRARLARAAALAAALQRSAEITIEYAGQREQFGKPISHFQAVQTHLTRLASEAQRVAVLVDAARERVEKDGRFPAGIIAAAKVLTGEAAIVAARTAHQVHGAIGVTMEYPLQRYSKRLWSWSLADGTTEESARMLGRKACAMDLGAWRLITSTDDGDENA
ncbi:acyl-CoA dehydrogenase family protein [Rhodococcus jostii]|uniref:acyl-CoA dehydrogenase family protein n=1 Tax=Rhodococcus jostii TaxID=132919 RepID=UPI001F07DE8B|nr:acyl-CoA dehydrogenase family protein [Rhodococcus jostii]